MRIRTIKPEFWTDKKVASLSYLARLLFIGLWNLCDDEGRFLADPRIIKGSLFPLDDKTTTEDVAGALSELSVRAHVLLTELDGEKYGCCPNFVKHQRINRPTRSKLPKISESSVSTHGGLSEPSLTEREREREVEREGKGTGETQTASSASPAGASRQIPAEEIFELYPLQTGKAEALIAINKALATKELAEAARAAGQEPDLFLASQVDAFARHVRKHRGQYYRMENGVEQCYILHGAKWFKLGRYLDNFDQGARR